MKYKSLPKLAVLGFLVFGINNIKSQEFYGFKNWSFNLKTTIYESSKIEPKYGSMTIENKPMFSGSIGVDYHIFNDKKWSIIMGGYLSFEPAYNFGLELEQKELYPHFTENYIDRDIGYAFYSFSFPVLVEWKMRMAKNVYFNTQLGLLMKWFPEGGWESNHIFVSEDGTESRLMFTSYGDSREFPWYPHVVVGGGFYFVLNKTLLKTNINYYHSFINLYEGEYQFDNLMTSKPSGGSLITSGSHIAISVSIYLRNVALPRPIL